MFGDVHHHADEARALLAFEERLAAGFHPAQAAVIEEHAIGGAEFTTVFTGDGTGDFLAYPLAVLRVAEAFEQRHVHRVLFTDTEHGPTALVPDQRAALRFVVPHAQACRVDRQACAYLDLAQSLLGLQAAASFVDFGQGPFHCLGQKAEVLLEHVVDGAGAHHVDRMLLAEHAGKEDEGCLRCQSTRFLQRLAAGEAWQDEVRQDQVEGASL